MARTEGGGSRRARRGLRRPRFLSSLLVGAGAALLLQALPADAQVVRGRVWDASTRSGLATVFVTLQDEAGERVAADLTRGDGRYRLSAPSPGFYRLTARRIGYDDYGSPGLLEVGAGETTEHDIVLRARRHGSTRPAAMARD